MPIITERPLVDRSPYRVGADRLSAVIVPALVAGIVAIIINIIVLDTLAAAGIATGGGALQKLVRSWLSAPLVAAGVNHGWTLLGLPGPDTDLFKTGFKVLVGLLMALVYTLLLAPRLRGGSLRKGLIAALLFWLVNAFVVLPLLGDGIAGVATLTPTGIVSFALAHSLFFVVLAYMFTALRQRRPS